MWEGVTSNSHDLTWYVTADFQNVSAPNRQLNKSDLNPWRAAYVSPCFTPPFAPPPYAFYGCFSFTMPPLRHHARASLGAYPAGGAHHPCLSLLQRGPVWSRGDGVVVHSGSSPVEVVVQDVSFFPAKIDEFLRP